MNRARVLQAAVDLADRDGIDSVSMRKLGQHLGIEAMSLYTHIRGKGDLLDGMVDAVVGEIPIDVDWSRLEDDAAAACRGRLAATCYDHSGRPDRDRRAGPAMMLYVEAVTGILLDGGLHGRPARITRCTSWAAGFWGSARTSTTIRAIPDPEAAAVWAAQLASVYPNIGALAMAASHEGGIGGCDDDDEFAFGLDLMLDGLERRRVS